MRATTKTPATEVFHIKTISIENYISFLSSLILAGGILFELPLFIYFLTKIGLVNEKLLKEYRKHAIVIILFLSALITPPDVSSQIILSLPFIGRYAWIMIIELSNPKK